MCRWRSSKKNKTFPRANKKIQYNSLYTSLNWLNWLKIPKLMEKMDFLRIYFSPKKLSTYIFLRNWQSYCIHGIISLFLAEATTHANVWFSSTAAIMTSHVHHHRRCMHEAGQSCGLQACTRQPHRGSYTMRSGRQIAELQAEMVQSLSWVW